MLFRSNMDKFMGALGVSSGQWTKHRAMLPRYIFKISDDAVSTFRQTLNSLTVNGHTLQMNELGNGVFQIKLGQENLDDEKTIVRLRGEQRRLIDVGLVNMAIQDESGSYAYHVPHGILILYDPALRRSQDCGTISTLDIAPTLLANFGVARPGYMRSALSW